MSPSSPQNGAEHEERISALVNEFFERRQAGENVTPESFAAEHPDLAEELRPYLAGLPLIEFSALHYTIEDLTQVRRGTMHTTDLVERDLVALNLDYRQMGVGGDNSWGARTHEEYTLPAGEYGYRFRLRPITRDDNLMALSKVRYDLD